MTKQKEKSFKNTHKIYENSWKKNFSNEKSIYDSKKGKSFKNTHKLHENSLKKFFEIKNQYD